MLATLRRKPQSSATLGGVLVTDFFARTPPTPRGPPCSVSSCRSYPRIALSIGDIATAEHILGFRFDFILVYDTDTSYRYRRPLEANRVGMVCKKTNV